MQKTSHIKTLKPNKHRRKRPKNGPEGYELNGSWSKIGQFESWQKRLKRIRATCPVIFRGKKKWRTGGYLKSPNALKEIGTNKRRFRNQVKALKKHNHLSRRR